ncbi:hypothetical protein [Streptomyces pharetrae]
MQLLPIPCPARLIPDATGTDAFHGVYRTAVAQPTATLSTMP